MARAASWLWKALLVLLFIAWQLLVHRNVSGGDGEAVRYALLVLPLGALAYWIAMHARHKALWAMVLAAGCACALYLERQGGLGIAAAYGLPHAAVYIFLLFLFGHTLLPGRDALITRLARRVHGALPPYMETYTVALTAAWCVFFAAQLLTSALLFAFATLNAWSVFVNLLNFPLLLLMFVGEYVCRVVRYPDFPHATIAQAVRAFASDPGVQSGGLR